MKGSFEYLSKLMENRGDDSNKKESIDSDKGIGCASKLNDSQRTETTEGKQKNRICHGATQHIENRDNIEKKKEWDLS